MSNTIKNKQQRERIEDERAVERVRAMFDQVEGIPAKMPIPKEITFNGHTVTFYFRELTAFEMTNALKGNEADKLLAAIITDQMGRAKLTPADIGRIKPALRTLLRSVAMEINQLMPPSHKLAQAITAAMKTQNVDAAEQQEDDGKGD